MGSSHHGDDRPFAEQEMMRKFIDKNPDFLQRRFADQMKGKAAPLFPKGKLRKDDEGGTGV